MSTPKAWRSIRYILTVLGASLVLNFLWISLASWPSSSSEFKVPPCPECPSCDRYRSDSRDQPDDPPSSQQHHPGYHIPRLRPGDRHPEKHVPKGSPSRSDSDFSGHHKLAVVVPFRDRFDELLRFVPHMAQFLADQRVQHEIYVINQADEYRFNRAALINVGFLLSKYDCDYLVMHDVDLLPINPAISYRHPDTYDTIMDPGRRSVSGGSGGDSSPGGPVIHIASPELHPKYHYKSFAGGILMIKRADFQLVNGLSNRYWGWGLEDDEFAARLRDAKLPLQRPVGITTGPNDTFLHIHSRARKRDMAKLHNQREVTKKRDRETGLNTIQFKIASEQELTVDGFQARVINVRLHCDLTKTPWCQFPPPATTQPGKRTPA